MILEPMNLLSSQPALLPAQGIAGCFKSISGRHQGIAVWAGTIVFWGQSFVGSPAGIVSWDKSISSCRPSIAGGQEGKLG